MNATRVGNCLRLLGCVSHAPCTFCNRLQHLSVWPRISSYISVPCLLAVSAALPGLAFKVAQRSGPCLERESTEL